MHLICKYTLNGNSNILHAISVAGGIDEFEATEKFNQLNYRNIRHMIC